MREETGRSGPKTTILIGEEDRLLGELLTEALARHAGFRVVGTVGTREEVLTALSEQKPQVLLLDVDLPGSQGLSLLEATRQSESACQVLVLSRDESEEAQLEAARNGADGFIGKSSGVAKIADAISRVTAGEVWFTRHVVGAVLREHAALLKQTRAASRPDSVLSERERDVLQRLGRGWTNQQIAENLGTSVSTVKVQIRSIFQKLGLPNRTEAALFAQREGLVMPASGNQAG